MKHDISKQLPKDIQPYERCMEQGAGVTEIMLGTACRDFKNRKRWRKFLSLPQGFCDRKSFRACVYDQLS